MGEYETRRCAAHGQEVALVTKAYAEQEGLEYGCPGCRAALTVDARDPETMSGDERATEVVELLEGDCLAGFDAVWHRIDALVGRGTYTHELVLPAALAEEARARTGVTNTEVVENRLRSLIGDKPVVVLNAEDVPRG